MKIWNKGNSETNSTLAKQVEKFTVGSDKDWDILLAKYDVIGSMAHANMLEKIGLLSVSENEALQKELAVLLKKIEQDIFVIEDGLEDVHSQVEKELTEKLGEIGKKIHSGRSRNDQSLLDIKLFIRAELESTVALVGELFDMFLKLSNRYRHVLLPGYTHTQIAMPSSFGLWFGAYAESLSDDMELVWAAYKVAKQNPLGSGAGYGGSFPLDREYTTQELGFDGMNVNSVYAQLTRGKTEKITAMALATLAGTLNKFASDVCLYISQNFGFISFPDELTTGSSIMPHKKNPDVFELIRAKTNRIQAVPNELMLMGTNLISGYHRDWQLTKECLFPAFSELKNCLSMLLTSLEHIRPNEAICVDEKYAYLFSVEAVNKLVMQGVSFRDAYKKIGADIADGKYKAETELSHTHIGSIGNLRNDLIEKRFAELKARFL